MPDIRRNITSQDGGAAAHHSQATDVKSSQARDANPHGDLETSVPLDQPALVEINHEPYRRRIANPTRGVLKKLARWVKETISPTPTPEEIARMSEKKRMQLLSKTLVDEAKIATRRISNSLHQLGFSYVRKDANGNITSARYVTFDFVESTEDAHWLHVDMGHWPYGINSDQLLQQDVINHISRSVGHKVNVKASPEAGIWFVIERASGMMGIPVHVPIADMWQKMPQTSTKLTVPIGMTNNRKVVYDNLDEMVHTLVAGQTGGGKSTLVNGWITTLITRNSPDQLRLVLMDMKAGLEFQYFAQLPHLLEIPDVKTDEGVITESDYVAPALHWLVNVEARRRLEMIRKTGHRDIRSYNVKRKKQLPRIVVVIDEWAQARLGNGGKHAELELAKALQLLRAAGIHFIVCTQTPSKEVLNVLARSNLPTRVAFSCAELSASMLICGDGSAVALAPAGRCIYKRMTGTQPVQVAWISEQMVTDIVDKVKRGETPDALPKMGHDVSTDDILDWALHENGGSLRHSELHSHFSHRGITQRELTSILADLENSTVEIAGNFYRIEPGAGARPRRLVAVMDQETDKVTA